MSLRRLCVGWKAKSFEFQIKFQSSKLFTKSLWKNVQSEKEYREE